MIGKIYAADPAAGMVAAASGAGAVATSIGEVTTPLLGVPLPVVLAAIAGAMLARAYLEPIGFFKSAGRVLGWVVLGCALAPLVQAIGSKLLGGALPTNALAGMAAIVAAAEAWPMLLRWVRAEFPGVWTRIFGAKGGGDGSA